jgi:hypothetical protein
VWFVKTPITLPSGRRVVAIYEINAAERVLTARVVADLSDPI